ncbi:MAG: aldehyde ferredoxin oxidoreductase [Chloroflexi bacterium]|nr:MAG: aldehyde ferredoxin oxidoreductase [Chloroflexota bacterium]
MANLGKTLVVDYKPDFKAGKRPYTGSILHVDLSTGEMSVEEPPDSFYRQTVGGRGIILHYLLKDTKPKIDPLSPENLLIFAPGILTGTVLPGTGRHAVGAKSPLTGALASGEAGGWWGSELKRAGFDALVINGKAETPVYLWIHEGVVEIRDAGHLWGKTTGDTNDGIVQELGDDKIRIAQIGPAGENLVRYACIIHDSNRAAGRSGLGAVMGSKNLKAVVVRGKGSIGIADKKLMSTVTNWILKDYKNLMGWAVSRGTSGSVVYNHNVGATAIHNYLDGVFPGVENIDGEKLFEFLVKDRDTCYHCPVRCKLVVEHQGEVVIEPRYGGPEYETLGAIGPMCLVNDPVVVAKAHELCSAYGLDTISTGGTIAFAMECQEKSLLDGYDFLPKFGYGASLLHSIVLIAKREGLGDFMAEGSERMAQKLGGAALDMAVTCRGQELPMHDPRLKNAIGMGYALSATGADHMHNLNDTFATFLAGDLCARLQEMGIPVPLPLWGIEDVKIEGFYYETAFKNFLDSAVICHFYPYEYHHMVDALKGALGWDMTADEINEIGTRIITLARLYLLREGFTHQDDMLPARAYYPLPDGPIAGKAMTPEIVEEAMQRYFKRMDWDQDGVPSVESLIKLGIIFE